MNLKKVSKLMLSTFLALTLSQGFNPVSVQAATQPTKTAIRVQGLDRFKTSRAIAEKIGFGELENVVITSGFGFADGLSASTFAKKLNAPLLLAGDLKSSSEAIAYISSKLKSEGNVYIIGGEGVVSKDTENALTAKGYKVTRIFGKGRIETNNAIINELDVAEGTPVFISNALGYADALSASGVAAIKDYPMLLTNADKLPDLIKNQLTKIKPSKVYVVGGEAVVKPAVVNEIKAILPSVEIVRLGGSTRYETSMSIFKEFNLDTKNIVLASGKGFADALSGSQLAVKLNAPMVLADEANLYKQQLEFDKKELENYYLLGGTGSLSNNVEQFVVMDINKEFEDIKAVLNNIAEAVKLKDIEKYMAQIDPNAPGYKETREVYAEFFADLIQEQVDIEAIYESIDMISMNAKEAKVKVMENDKITYKDPETGENITDEETYQVDITLKKVNGQWKVYSSESIE
ncbi:cell wall-binding repeat-containing protein [Clostridium peptidivorans]|uniref:cell wall-binding repeat-containing protein n=1 Tax=Clostridium peptidivorans TaxID=100174 RepID=UPI000BE2AD9F|nr:cell wall-binding repeat-containing protein [Clostridium peptidivorans]